MLALLILVFNLFFTQELVICCVACATNWFLRFYLLVFLNLLTLFSYCAHSVGRSTCIVLQLVQDLIEPEVEEKQNICVLQKLSSFKEL